MTAVTMANCGFVAAWPNRRAGVSRVLERRGFAHQAMWRISADPRQGWRSLSVASEGYAVVTTRWRPRQPATARALTNIASPNRSTIWRRQPYAEAQ